MDKQGRAPGTCNTVRGNGNPEPWSVRRRKERELPLKSSKSGKRHEQTDTRTCVRWRAEEKARVTHTRHSGTQHPWCCKQKNKPIDSTYMLSMLSVFCTPQVWCLSSFSIMAALSFLPPSLVPCPGILKVSFLSPCPATGHQQLYLPSKTNYSRFPQCLICRRTDSCVIWGTQFIILKAALDQTQYKPRSQNWSQWSPWRCEVSSPAPMLKARHRSPWQQPQCMVGRDWVLLVVSLADSVRPEFNDRPSKIPPKIRWRATKKDIPCPFLASIYLHRARARARAYIHTHTHTHTHTHIHTLFTL